MEGMRDDSCSVCKKQLDPEDKRAPIQQGRGTYYVCSYTCETVVRETFVTTSHEPVKTTS
jgi:YHS domain-containing protein